MSVISRSKIAPIGAEAAVGSNFGVLVPASAWGLSYRSLKEAWAISSKWAWSRPAPLNRKVTTGGTEYTTLCLTFQPTARSNLDRPLLLAFEVFQTSFFPLSPILQHTRLKNTCTLFKTAALSR